MRPTSKPRISTLRVVKTARSNSAFLNKPPALALSAAALGLALAALGRPSFAGEPRPPGEELPARKSPAIVRIEIVGSITLTPEALRRDLATRVGRPYDPAVLNNDLHRLLGTGRYRSVRWTGPEAEGDLGVRLTLTVEERPILEKIEYRGRRALTKDDLRLEAKRIGLQVGPRERYVEALAFRLARKLEDNYKGKGRFLAKVRYFTEALKEPTPQGLARVKLVFDLKEGAPAPVRGVRFVGNRAYTDRELWKIMAKLLKRSSASGGRKSFDRLRFEQALRFIEQEMYRDKGYLDARVELGALELFTSDPPRRRKRQWVVPRVRIDEGSVYTVGKIILKVESPEGDKPLEVTREEIMSAVTMPTPEYKYRMPLEEGEVYSERAVEQARWRIGNLLGHHGRIASRVRGRPHLASTGSSIDVAFTVNPSRAYRVGGVAVRGNYKTKPNVFRRELWYARVKPTRKQKGRIVPGDLIDTRKIELAERNIRFTGLVENEFDKNTGRLLRPDVGIRSFPRDDGTADLTIDVNEGETGMLQMGASVNSNGELAGQIQLSQRNFDIFGWPRSLTDWTNAFIGSGQTLNLTASFGTGVSRRYLRADFEEPYFLGIPVELGVGLYDYESDQGPYTERHTGGNVSFSRFWSLHDYKRRRLALWMRFKYDYVQTSEVDPLLTAEFPVEAAQLVSGGLGISYDSRDRRMLPSQGSFVRLSGDLVGSIFGGEKDFTKMDFDLQSYFRLGTTMNDLPFVLRLRVWLDRADPAGTEVPFYERYFAGGIGTLRGFDYRSVGPRDGGAGTTSIGGNLRLLESLEYTFPIGSDGNTRGSVFYDVGNVWGKSSDFDFVDQKQSVGVGLLLFPKGPIPMSLYWGWIIGQEPGDNAEIFSFTLGTIFF